MRSNPATDRMKVLVISQSYPPYPQVGGLRAKKVAEMFRDRGHFVTVITERLESEHQEVRLSEGRLLVRTVHAGLPYRLRLVALRNRLQGRTVVLSSWDGSAGGASDSNSDDSPSRMHRWMRTTKRLITDLLRFPDDQQQFVAPAFRMGRQVARNTGVDLVYTTAPAFSAHFVGLLLQRKGVRWVAEFRDPWTAERPAHETKVPYLLRLNRWLERQCLVRADVVVAVTESVGRQLAAKLPVGQKSKVIVAMNGIDLLQPPRTPASKLPPYRIAYTGSFYHDRDPSPFLHALAGWMHDKSLGAEDVQVDFAGRCRHYSNVSVERIVQDLNLSDIVRFHDWLSPTAVQEVLNRADLFLLLARSQPAQVPNKLFEYLGSRTPMLAVVDKNGESATILNAVGGQFVLATPEGEPVTAGMLREALELAYSQRSLPVTTDESALEKLLTQRQFSHLASALGV